ncbi:MAG TPA: hypothetical protein VIK94_01055 [Bacilli bacterium]
MKEYLLKFLGYLLLTIAFYALYIVFVQRKKQYPQEIGYKGQDNSQRPQVFNKMWFKIIVLIISLAFITIGWILVF